MTLIKKTFSVAPHMTDPLEFIAQQLLKQKSVDYGFVTKVNDVSVKKLSISSIGNYVYEVEARVDCFLPAPEQEVEAIVEMNRGSAHIAICKDRLKILFYSDECKPSGSRVVCVLKEVKFQCGTYRAVADLKELASEK